MSEKPDPPAGNVAADVLAARNIVYPPPTGGNGETEYEDSPVTSVHERSIDVCCGLLVLSDETAAGIVK